MKRIIPVVLSVGREIGVFAGLPFSFLFPSACYFSYWISVIQFICLEERL